MQQEEIDMADGADGREEAIAEQEEHNGYPDEYDGELLM